ncbi:hypothetical protein PVAND_006655 [Polypedilum vanderplanki]|uniref:UDP-glucuronosyltransferase n=1 Tax=Polypedilum vanderplanki TaxID=319348 RepID=A0A9J6C4S2_POLVA|nr:hypothetical protein PVAND_006655 [Polypedilum vanderplanki]
MKFLLNFIIILCILLALPVNCHRILGLFPHPGHSHFQFFHPIMKALAERGHEVTVVSEFPNKEPLENYHDEILTNQGTGLLNFVSLDNFKTQSVFQHFFEFFMLREWGKEACAKALNSSAIKNVLNKGRREPFDLIIVELFNTDCMMGVAHKLKAPVIGLSSCNILPWHFTQLGLPYETNFYPVTFLGASDKMSYTQRISNWFAFVYMNIMYKIFSQNDANKLLRQRFGDDFPDVSDLTKKVSMMFVNQHYSLSGAKHISPNIIELGGIHIEKPNSIDSKLQNLLDNAKNGVIYISWGSMVKADSLSELKREGILRALGKFKQLVLWKYENDTLPNQPSNVIIRKWMPQREILCHPNTRVFLTHGGLMGSSEAAYCGVPVVATPFYGDQFLNVAALENRAMGVILKYNDINEQTVHHSLRRVLDAKYRENAKKVQYSFKHRPMPPIETAVFWSEYVIASGGAHLVQPYTVYANWFIYSGLDIILTILSAILFFIGSWIYIIRKCFFRNKKLVDSKKSHQVSNDLLKKKN